MAATEPVYRNLNRGVYLLCLVFVLTLPLVNPYIRGDGNGYYAYVRSLAIDGDLDFGNEYRRADPAFAELPFEVDGSLRPAMAMPNSYVRNQWAVGPSLLWTPFFLAAHGLVHGLNQLGFAIDADGYSRPYRWACALGTALYAFIGLLLAYQMAAELTTPRAALFATAGTWFASSLPVYMYFLPFHVHALAAFSVSLFLWYWLRTRHRRTLKQWGLWGMIGGLMVEVYYLNAVFLLITLFDWLKLFQSSAIVTARLASVFQRFALCLLRSDLYSPSFVLPRIAGEERGGGSLLHAPCSMLHAFDPRSSAIKQGVVFGIAIAAALLPHFIIKWIIHGSPLISGYEDGFLWTSPNVFELAFSTEHGLFLWTPVLLIAIGALPLLWRRDRDLAGGLILTFLIFFYVVASYQNWHGISSFGNRFFVSFTPVFVLGLAVFFDESQAFLSRGAGQSTRNRRHSMIYLRSMLYVSLALLGLWNIGLVYQWGTNLVPHRGPVDFAVAARNQLMLVPHGARIFLLDYFTNREQVIREIERVDLLERKDFRLRR